MKKNYTLSPKSHTLKIGWLYPDLMSTYGDRGNIIVLQKRCEWRGINIEILNIDENTADSELKNVNILFGGGAQDREQKIVIENLFKKKELIKNLIENDIPSLFVCGSPQLLGKYYEPEEGKRIEGLGIFDMISTHPGKDKQRLIGNVIAKAQIPGLEKVTVVGFENHGGRTILSKSALPFAKIIKGHGNNGTDGTEGIFYKNAIGSYFHGPLLPKNPEIADWLIAKALEVKYKKVIELKNLDDSLSHIAKSTIAKRLGVKL